MYIVIGLGNPSEEYSHTRHNTGRMAADFLAEKVSGIKVLVPDTFMNHSGSFVAKAMKDKKLVKKLIIIYDDLDLPLGTIKISYDRGSGGHNGLESVIKALKTREFIRIRVGIAPTMPSGKMKARPHGGKELENYILTDFKKPEMEKLKKVFKTITTVVEMIKDEGLTQAMTEFNS
ncbi:aminoacyl-tRNA hydrolase [Candidatus Parcubacteria bacterium]|nr:aminoacyl-tRNA hydrolase [Candidatus Parcubacteria bacterium]